MKTYKLLFNDDISYIQPEDYLRAAGECLFLMLLIGAIITQVYTPEIFVENPLKTRMGYNNFCVGIDMPPASYIIFPLGVLAVYFSIQYNIYDSLRTIIVKERLSKFQKYFSIVSNYLFVFSVSGFLLILLITPFDNVWVHTILFFQLIFFRTFVILANYYEHPNVNLSYKIYVILYTIISIVGVSIAIANYIHYDNCIEAGGINCGPLVPWFITMTLDYTWFLLLFLQSIIPLKGEKLNIKYSELTLN